MTEDATKPTVTANGGTLTCNITSVTLSATSTAQVVGWTGPNAFTSAERTPTVSVPGTYTVTVRDDKGCEATASTLVIEDRAIPVVIAVGGALSCENLTVILSATTEGTIVGWTGPNNYTSPVANPTATAPGEYIVTVRGANGCEAKATAVVTGSTDALQLETSSTASVCEAMNGTATVKVTGGTPSYQYKWSNGGTNPTITNLIPGVYTVEVTDAGGCKQTASVSVGSIQSDLVLSFDNVSPASCAFGAIGTAMVNVTGGKAPYKYQWNDRGAQTTAMAINLQVGTVTVVVRDADGCVATASVTIEEEADCKAKIGDFVWEDGNRDGIQGEGPKEAGLSGVTVKLLNKDGGVLRITQSDAFGKYLFEGLRPGQYLVEFDAPEGYSATLPNRGNNKEKDSDINMLTLRSSLVTLDYNDCDTSIDAGFYRTVSLGDFVWLDVNCNGLQDVGEPGIGSVRVELHGSDGMLASTVTNPDGSYRFTNLPPGAYGIKVIAPEGYTFTEKNVGSDKERDSDVNAEGKSELVFLYSGTVDNSIDAGLKGLIDLELTKNVDKGVVLPGDIVTFTIEVANKGNMKATGVEVTDYLPNGYISIDASAQNGKIIDTTVVWSDLTIDVNEVIKLTIKAEIADLDPSVINLKNIAQVTQATQKDIDSTPNNDDGTQSEDDEDSSTPRLSVCDVTLTVVKSNAICESSNGTIEIIAQGGSGVYSFKWSNGATTAKLTGLAAGTYSVEVSDTENCTVTLDVEVGLSTEVLRVTADVVNLSCDGVLGSVSTTVTGGTAPYKYKWSNGATTANIMNLNASTYSLEVTDANGCKGETQVVVRIAEGCEDLIDLELIKRVNESTPMPGDTIVFQLTLFNNSTTTATGVELSDYVPNGFVVIPSTIRDGGVLDSDNVIRWSNKTVPGFTLFRTAFQVIVQPRQENTVYLNLAEVTKADQKDVDSTPDNMGGAPREDDESSAIASPESADIAIFKFVSNATPDVREVITYTILVVNEGNTPATKIEVTDYLPIEYCNSFSDISNSGIFLGDRIIWSELNLAPGDTVVLSFKAEVAAAAEGQTVFNYAEVTKMDQTDDDSKPNNFNGTPREDDESFATFTVGAMADLELMKETDIVTGFPGDIVEFTITLVNKGPSKAFGVVIEDILPDGYKNATDVSHGGNMVKDRILWNVNEIGVDSVIVFSFKTEIVFHPNLECDYRNVAQVKSSLTPDPDSRPGNLVDGNVVEDDEDYAEVDVQLRGTQCVAIDAHVFLAGPYDANTGLMTTTLNRLGYLPGQRPSTFLGNAAAPGQPYSGGIWKYDGKEGDKFIQNGPVVGLNANYPSTVTDWVLVSLRSDKSVESEVCKRAALLHNDGRIEFVDGFTCCEIDPSQRYYIVIEHRNHLIVMSHLPLPVIDGKLTYDFRVRNSYRNFVGVGQREVVQGTYAMFASNGDQTTTLEAVDINVNDLSLWLRMNNMNSGYFEADFNLNGDVNVEDKSRWLLNNGLFSDVPR